MTSQTDSARQALSSLAGRHTVLVVDDEESVREMIAVILELEGYRVLQAENGEQALYLAGTEELHLITLDVMMPGLDGWQVADALDARDTTRAVPRVMVSGKPLDELDKAPSRSRASAVLSKPFDFAEFIDIVRRLVATPIPQQRLSAQPVPQRVS